MRFIFLHFVLTGSLMNFLKLQNKMEFDSSVFAAFIVKVIHLLINVLIID